MKKLSWRRYKSQIEGYGYSFSLKRFVISLLIFFFIIVGFGFLYRLDFIYILFVSVLCVICLPIILKAGYKNIYEARRFSDICLYMEQMCASFNKQPKILSALKDVKMVSEGNLQKLINQAIDYIEKGETKSDYKSIYEEALLNIEEAYKCKRLLELHRFLIKIETGGGEFKTSLNCLLKDIHAWVERTYIFQREKKSVRIYFGIGILISLTICTTSLFLGKYVEITENIIYKIVTSLFIFLCVVSYTLMEKSLMGSWLENLKNEELIMSEYHTALYSSPGKIRKKMIPFYLIIIVLSLVLLALGIEIFAFIGFFIFLIFFSFPTIRYKTAFNRTVSEIKYSFSEWIRAVAVNLQHYTVQMALQESYEGAPEIIKEPLAKLLHEISEDTNSATPYFNFLYEFNIHEVSSAMKMLYSLTELGADDVSQTLEALMSRNYALIDKAEKEVSENKMMLLKQIVSGPLVFAGGKIVVDMLIFVTYFISQMGDFSQYIN